MSGHSEQSSGHESVDPDHPVSDEEFFQRMVSAASDAIITANRGGTIVYANDAVEDLLGYAPDDVCGRQFTEFVPERLRDRYDGWFDRYSEGGRGTPFSDESFEVTWITADGDEERFSASAFEHESDGQRLFTGFLREAPERSTAGERLREEEALIEEIFDTSPIAISVRDAEGELLRANQRAAELVGLDPDQIATAVEDEAAVKEWSLYRPDGEPIPQTEHPVNRVLRTGEPIYNEEIVVERSDGDRVYLSVNATPIYEDGELQRVVSAAEDVTELKQSQFELERRRDELESELAEVFDRIADAFFALDDDWKFTYVNDEAEQLLSRPEEELVGKSIWEAFSGAVGTTFQREYERAMETQEPVSFVEYYPPLSAWFEVRAYPSETGLSVYFRDVSQRVERERELERYETIVETVTDGIYVVDDDGTFSMVNSAFEEITGYDEDELCERSPSMFYDEEIGETVEQRQREILAGERSSATVEHDLETADGDTLRVEVTFTVREADDGHERIGILRDITERKQREAELEWTKKRFKKVFEASHDAIFINDPYADELLDANPAGCEMLGYSRDEILSLGPSDFHPDEMDRFRRFVDGVSEEGSGWTDELTCLHSDGHRIPVEMSASMMEFDERQLMVVIVRDITERKERERELREQNERLDAFASMLAHELRNPLEIAQIYLDMGVDGDEEAFEEVERALDRIDEMIETLLVVTRRGGDVDTAEAVNLGEMAEEWWETVESGGTLAVETDSTILADLSRLRQLFENLYRNAVEHGGQDVTVRVGDLTDGFYVEDDGPGIPAEERGEVFEPGYSTSNVGIGFGLAVVRQLVDAHDWDCEITESPDGGARFEFTGVEFAEE